MAERLSVTKTYKLYINGQFPRSESGRSLPAVDPTGEVSAHVAHASRKDLRDAVGAARGAMEKWSGSTAYLRGQILYRMAEMLESRRGEFERALSAGGSDPAAAAREVSLSVDRLVHYAGWADKFQQVLGCNNAVAGPYYNFTVPEATGVVAAVAPDEYPLLALVSLVAPALCAGCTVVGVASPASPVPGAILGEACATSDVPAGAVNLLTGVRSELIPWIASHRDLDAVHAANLPEGERAALRAGCAENLKRVTVRTGVDFADEAQCCSPWWIEPMVEMKTVWHPSAT